MSIPSSARNMETSTMTNPERKANQVSITLSESALLTFALLRIFVGYLWFQELFWKLPPTFGGLHIYVAREVGGAFIPGYGTIVQNVLLPNFGLLGTFTFTAELLIGLSLMLGVFSRFGALLALVMSIQLYIGLSNTEWYWTYGMIVLLAVMLLPFPTGRRLGIDQWLAPRLQAIASRSQNRITHLLAWLA